MRGLDLGLGDVAQLEVHCVGTPPRRSKGGNLPAAEPAARPPFSEQPTVSVAGTPRRLKCRSRSPFWLVPGLQRAPRRARQLHVLCLPSHGGKPGGGLLHQLDPWAASPRLGISPPCWRLRSTAASASSLASRSRGGAYRGGILKIEPRELDRVLVPWPDLSPTRLNSLAEEVDGLLRADRWDEASRVVDIGLLQERLGLSERSISLLQTARRRLLERRTGRRMRGRKSRPEAPERSPDKIPIPPA